MPSTPIQFKQRNVLKVFIFVGLGTLLLLIGLIGYFTTNNFIYFYLIAAANIALAYIFFTSRVKKNQVIFDPVFIKYKLGNKENKKIKNSALIKALLTEHTLQVDLKNQESITINLNGYCKEDQVYFEKLVNSLAPPKN